MIRNILIIRLSSIGDVLLTTPLIRILNKKFPGSHIDFVIKKEFHELIAHHPALSEIYVFDKHADGNSLADIRKKVRLKKYDYIIDIHKNFRSYYLSCFVNAGKIVRFRKYLLKRWLLVNFKLNFYKHIIPVYQRYLDVLNLQDDNKGLDIYIPRPITDRIERDWHHRLTGKQHMVIGVAPGASFDTKRWHIEGYKEVVQYLSNTLNSTIILFGNHSDSAVTSQLGGDNMNVFDCAGKLSLSETAAVMNYCTLVLTNDSGLMHMAAALKKKVVAIFGSTTEELGFFPYAKEYRIIQNNSLNCRPCSHVGKTKCPKNHFKCMSELNADEVIREIRSMIDE